MSNLEDTEKDGQRTARTASAWVVTARHRSTAAVKPPEPFGSWHARRPEDAFTACGLPAAGWPIFWHLTHVQGRDRICVECQEVMYS
ncbi:hypothetical protein DDE18_21435 [Nocardioides gansuensis]|uniref:Uncharacterized protein n=1 Tax=Nocardioides gansuensis TaxID=2138300 RepID=A0A2T8F524_9ACTN|nr:hypothetical protein [Nocardioides gansuensis]PVG80815.1 hypothetical protein DDE18_21435 [Nocardioides gansuensis]